MLKTNPFYKKIMEERGEDTTNIETVENFFIPTKSDIEKIKKQLTDCKTVIDIGSGYGKLVQMLAETMPDKSFLGIDTMYWDKRFKRPESRENLQFDFTGIEAMTSPRISKKPIKKYDCVLCCWMPQHSDWREMLDKLCNKIVILILSINFGTATPETYLGMKNFDYKQVDFFNSKESIIQIWKKINFDRR